MKRTIAPVCEIKVIDSDKVNRVKNELPDSAEIFELAETFKTLGDQTRLRILLCLLKTELCVCDLSTIIGVSVSGISHQLRYLKNNRLVKFRKHGKIVYYSLDDNHIKTIIRETQKHVREN